VNLAELSPADLYTFSSPGRIEKPLLEKMRLPAGTKYTELAPKPDTKTGRVLTEEELANWQRVIPIMKEILQDKRLALRARPSWPGSRERWKMAGSRRWAFVDRLPNLKSAANRALPPTAAAHFNRIANATYAIPFWPSASRAR